eukprot:11192810-Lingulodinium_polyedra.AAC.1
MDGHKQDAKTHAIAPLESGKHGYLLLGRPLHDNGEQLLQEVWNTRPELTTPGVENPMAQQMGQNCGPR